MDTPAFTAIELKNTHHVLGILSRDADPTGGGDLALLAPQSLTVRAPEEFASNAVPPDPPFQMQVPATQLEAVVVKGADSALRRQVFSNPMNYVVSSDGSVQVAAGGDIPVVKLKPAGAVVPAFKVDIINNAFADLPFTVIIQEAKPAPNKTPFVCITEGKITAGQSIADNVLITLVPDKRNPVLNPIPKGTPVHLLVAVAGHALTIGSDPNT